MKINKEKKLYKFDLYSPPEIMNQIWLAKKMNDHIENAVVLVKNEHT